MSLKDKVIVVTGGAEGLGHATAIQGADVGAKVIVADVNLDGAENTAKTITSNGGKACAVAVNLAQEDQVACLIEQTEKIFGQLDILILIFCQDPKFRPHVKTQNFVLRPKSKISS